MDTPTTELTVEQRAEEKAIELAKQLGVYKVYPILFKDMQTGDDVIGFLKHPPRIVQQRVMDKALQGATSASAELLEVILIKEASDERIYSENPAYDYINNGAVMAAYDIIKAAVNQFKKK